MLVLFFMLFWYIFTSHHLTMAKQILGFLLSPDISTFCVFDDVLCTFVNVCSMFHLAARHFLCTFPFGDKRVEVPVAFGGEIK